MIAAGLAQVDARGGRGRPARGFTLIEMLVTLVVLAVLASIAMPMADLSFKRSREQELRQNLRQIREAIDSYRRAWEEGRIQRKAGESGYPPSLEILVDGAEDIRTPAKTKIYFLRRIPGDPMAGAGVTGAASWGKRSYASPPQEPREGDDVYDVYSLSSGAGINGVPYREW